MFLDHIFRAYDIRGIADQDFDEAGAEAIGKAYASYLIRKIEKKNPRFVIGRDGRLSGEKMQQAFLRGVLSTGADAVDIGLSTSPLLFFSICTGGFDGGVNITASHNPRDYNGFKLQEKEAHAVCGDEIQEILKIAKAEYFEVGSGNLSEGNFVKEYFAKLKSLVKISGNPRIVIDCGNGIAGKFAEDLFSEMGCEIIPLYCEVDGNFPNHDADPEVEANLADLKIAVKKTGAHLGIAFDGDGDRVGVVDQNGTHFSADLLLVVLARDLLSRHPGAKIVVDLKATQNLFDEITKCGGEGIMVKTGHSFVEEKMRDTGALLGGEVSGHLFFGENYFGFDDAFLAAGKIIEIVEKSGKDLAEHFSDLPKIFTTPEIKIECPEEKKFQIVQELVDFFVEKYGDRALTIDGVRVDFGDGAWGIVRASNTSPKLTLRFEARDETKLAEIRGEMEGKVLELVNS